MKTELQLIPGTPAYFIDKAIEKGALDQLDKFLELKEKFEKSEAEKAFHLSLQKFQSKKPKLNKTKAVAFGNTKYKFLPLAKMQEQIDPILSECGLSYRWEQSEVDGKIEITCVLSHELGHSKTTSLKASHDNSGNKNSIQAIGSTVSYLKRYTLENALGLSADDDDDGQSIDVGNAKLLKLKLELCELLILKRSRLNESQIENLERIIIENEEKSYQKAVNHLKTY